MSEKYTKRTVPIVYFFRFSGKSLEVSEILPIFAPKRCKMI